MDQNRPLTPQEREWMREKQMSGEADSDSLDGVRLSPEEVARLRQGQQPGQFNPFDPPADGSTIPAIPMNVPRQNQTPPVQPQPPTPNAQEMAWQREKQMPGNPGQPAPTPPEFMPTMEALPQVSRQAPPPPAPAQVRPEGLPTREALPQVPRQQPGPPNQFQPKQDPMTAPALPQQPRPQPQNQTRPGPPQPPPSKGQPRPQNPPPPGQAPSRPYQPLGQGPNNTAGLSAQELQWQREKQAYPANPTGMTPQEQEWQREKQAYQQQTRPNPTPALNPQERQWQQEKQGYGTAGANPAGLSPQELEWQREKQNYGGAAAAGAAGMTAQERQWQQEKQGYAGAGMAPVPALTPQERQWQQEKQGGMDPQVAAINSRNPGPPPPYVPQGVARQPERRRPIWLWILIPLVLLLVAGAAVFFLLLNKPGPINNGTPTSGVASITGTPGVSASASPTTPGLTGTAANGNGTPGATSGSTTNGTATGGATTGTAVVSGTATAGASPSVATTSAQNETLFNQGKTAYDNKNYLDAIAAWEKVDPKSDTYTKVKPLLGDAYYNAANDLALNNTTSDSLTQAINYYNKASGIDPNNADYRTAGENASFYQSGAKSLSAKDWDTAVNLLSQLYSRNPNFRDGPQLYYAALEGQGDTAVAAGNLVSAKDDYSTALGLNFKSNPPDTTALQAKLTDVDAKLNPTPTVQPSPTTAPTVTIAPTKKPTPTPKPAPTNTPVPPQPCAKGGSGSNFFAFRTSQPQVPNVPDQGRSGVRGVVVDKGGAALSGATVRIATSGHVFTSVTDGGGNYFREGLGRGVWTISVVAAPGRTVCFAATGTVTLSGQSGFYGSVDFTESVP